MAVMEDLTINFEVELSALDQAKGKLENVKEGLGNLKKALLGLSAVIGSVGAASGLLLKNSASEGAKWEKLAKQTNMSTTALQEWSFVARRSGASAEAFQADMLKLQQSFKETGSSFDQEFMGMSKQMQGMEQSAAFAFGKTKQLSEDTIRVLMQGPEAIQAMRQQADQLGMIIPADSIADAVEFNAKLLSLSGTVNFLSNQFGMAFLPALNEVMGAFEDWIEENQVLISQNLKHVAEGMVEGFKVFYQVLEQIGSVFAPLLELFAPFLAEMDLMETVTQLVSGALLGLVVLFSPLLLKLGAITAGVLVLAYAFGDLIKFFQGGESYIGDFFNAFKERWPELYGAIEKAGTFIKENFAGALWSLWEVVQYVLAGLGSVFSSILDKINALAGPASDFFATFTENYPKVYGLLNELANFVGTVLKVVFDTFTDSTKIHFEALGSVIGIVFEVIKSCVERVEGFLKLINQGGELIKDVWGSFKANGSQNSGWAVGMPLRGGTTNTSIYNINQTITGSDGKQIGNAAINALPGQMANTPNSVPQAS